MSTQEGKMRRRETNEEKYGREHEMKGWRIEDEEKKTAERERESDPVCKFQALLSSILGANSLLTNIRVVFNEKCNLSSKLYMWS